MEETPYLPIKVVLPKTDDTHQQSGLGGPRKVFCEVTTALREDFCDKVAGIEDHFADAFEAMPNVPAVGRVLLRKDAIAKSHRPDNIFSTSTCPIIGVPRIGELLISVTEDGLFRLREAILFWSTKVATANISAIRDIKPFTTDDAVDAGKLAALQEAASEKGVSLKLSLFRHRHSTDDDQAVLRAFLELTERLGLEDSLRSIPYSPFLRVFRLDVEIPEALGMLASFVGTKSLRALPTYRLVRTTSTPLRELLAEDLPNPESGVAYPLVGLVDSGTDPGDHYLQPWIEARESFVGQDDGDFRHGSFVAGLMIHAQRMNHGDRRFPAVSSRIVDVAAVPRGGEVTEDELVAILEEVVPKHPGVRVWNLSLGTDDLCRDDAFSDLAIALDRLQNKHDVIFVLAAGNYDRAPYRGWPPEPLGEDDRICSPADSILGIAVGSLAHRDVNSSRVRAGEPSPFTRRGPGPSYIPKPDVTHIGGNCDGAGRYSQTGVLSTDGRGSLAEDVGTSFSAPLISSLLANVHNSLADPPSRSLLKALLVHSAVLEGDPGIEEDLRYRGFGVPTDVVGVLSCHPWSCTLVFETAIPPGQEFHKEPFPIPECLRRPDGKVIGEFTMTLAYAPPLDPSSGVEYCRSNVEASLGTFDKDKHGRLRHKRKIPPEPGDLSQKYERYLIEHGFKWSPLKVYRRHIRRGVRGEKWRLLVSTLYRSGFLPKVNQPFTLLITLRDPDRKRPVYDETVRLITSIGWSSIDLAVRPRLRV